MTANIKFRCWHCNRQYWKPAEQRGQRFLCSCQHTLKVPRHDNGRCRVKTPLDWLVEMLVYGGGGAVLGLGLGALIGSRLWIVRRPGEIMMIFTIVGFLFGTLGGEAGINLVGRMIRDRENA
jgi:hypothetical protein